MHIVVALVAGFLVAVALGAAGAAAVANGVAKYQSSRWIGVALSVALVALIVTAFIYATYLLTLGV